MSAIDDISVSGYGEIEREQATDMAMDFAPWQPPFHFETTSVFDSAGQRVCDMRGWGFLTGKGGGLGLGEDEAAAIQQEMGKKIALLMSRAAER